MRMISVVESIDLTPYGPYYGRFVLFALFELFALFAITIEFDRFIPLTELLLFEP